MQKGVGSRLTIATLDVSLETQASPTLVKSSSTEQKEHDGGLLGRVPESRKIKKKLQIVKATSTAAHHLAMLVNMYGIMRQPGSGTSIVECLIAPFLSSPQWHMPI